MENQQIRTTAHVTIDVMVSYSSKNRNEVLRWVQRLRSAGVAVWIDQGGIDGAQRWGEEIVNAIDACKTVLLMISRTSMESENIMKEVSLAWESGKKFLPLRLEEAKIPRSMQYQLAGIQHINLYEGDPEEKFLSVLRALVRLGVRVSPYYIAMISATVGDREQAFEWLNRALQERSAKLRNLENEPKFGSLRSDPRFAELVKQTQSVPLEEEDASAEIPILLPKPIPLRTEPAMPETALKRVFWPDVSSDVAARRAASQGIWASLALIVAAFAVSTLVGAPMISLGWNDPLVIAFIYIPIAIGIWKMGRPAAIAGLVLCSLGVLGNLMAISSMRAAISAYETQYAQYAQYARMTHNSRYQFPPNPMLSQYYYSWFGLMIGAACGLAFANATRGTLAYRQMVGSGAVADKQTALTAGEWKHIRKGAFRWLPGVRGRTSAVAMGTPAIPAQAAPAVMMAAAPAMTAPISRPLAVVAGATALAPSPAAVPAHVPQASSAIVVQYESLAELLGVSKGSRIRVLRAAAFVVACVVAGLTYFAWRSVNVALPLPTEYWTFAVLERAAFALTTLAVFRRIRGLWAATIVAGVLSAMIAVPLESMLPSFAWADLFYREQFQQFFLLPMIGNLALLVGLGLAIPRVRPLPFALWVGALASEVLTPVVASLLKATGTLQPPDAILAASSIELALIRALIFALVWWGLVRLFCGTSSSRRRAVMA